jgi:hypothetical protein
MMRHAWVHRKGIVMLVGVLSPSVASSSWLTPSELDRPPEWKHTHPALGQGLAHRQAGHCGSGIRQRSAVVRGNETGLV